MKHTLTQRQQELLAAVESTPQSASHTRQHLLEVADYGAWLCELYQGRPEIVVAAAIVHDTGRQDPKLRGPESAKAAATVAPVLLTESGYSDEEIALITQCVAEHDDPNLHSVLLESRILKDADYLAGFGAAGILRSLVYAGETGGGMGEAIDRIQRKTPERLRGLEFAESRRLGWQKHRLTELFLNDLAGTPVLENVSYSGKFIVLEGISGSGKDTQGLLLEKYFTSQGQDVLFINHPTQLLKQVWREWKKEVKHEMSDVFMLLADRVRMVRDEILPALKEGKIVISSRSSLSAQAYQPSREFSDAFYRFCFQFEPVADALLYLDIKPEAALQRVDQRVEAGKEQNRGFFGQAQTSQYQLYEEMLQFYPQVFRIQADQSETEVHQEILKVLSQNHLVT